MTNKKYPGTGKGRGPIKKIARIANCPMGQRRALLKEFFLKESFFEVNAFLKKRLFEKEAFLNIERKTLLKK